MANAIWELEGQLLQVMTAFDRLKKKQELSIEESEKLEELQKRKAFLEQALRKESLKGF